MRKAFKSFIAAILVALALAGIIYLLLPKGSWINLRAIPASIVLEDFEGSYALGAEKISFFSGTMVNRTSTELSINGREPVKYEQGELVIRFERGDNTDEISRPDLMMFSLEVTDDYRGFYNAAKDQEADAAEVPFAMISGDTKDSIELRRPYASARTINFAERTITNNEENVYELNIPDTSDTIDLTFFEGSVIEVNYGRYNAYPNPAYKTLLKIYIQGEEIEIDTLKFHKQGTFDLKLDTQVISYFFDTNRENCSIRGKVSAFQGSFDGDNAVLKQTYLNDQNSYDISLLSVSASSKDTFRLKYNNLGEEHNVFRISGYAKEASVGDTSLNLSFITFLYKNLSAVVLAVFGAFVSTYIPLIIGHDKKQKTQNSGSPQGEEKEKTVHDTEADHKIAEANDTKPIQKAQPVQDVRIDWDTQIEWDWDTKNHSYTQEDPKPQENQEIDSIQDG